MLLQASTPIFIFGGSGYVGRNLLTLLCERGWQSTCLVRDERGGEFIRSLGAKPVVGDVCRPETYSSAVQPGSIVIYLIHAMGSQRAAGRFPELDRRAVSAMLGVSRQASVSRVIHLSGLCDPRERLSRHLQSRAEVALIIRESGIPAAVLRSSVIFGPGSASYEILRAALRLPIVPLPPWHTTRVQPIALADVIRSLVATIERPELVSRVLDIGGPDVYTYGGLLRKSAHAFGLRKKFFNLAFEARPVAALLLSKLSGVGVGETYALLESLSNTSVVPGENAVPTVFGFKPTPVFATTPRRDGAGRTP